MIRLLGPAEIRERAEHAGVRPSKKFGQNFVHDANTVRRIVRIAGVNPGETVMEVGPGLGSLTLGLLEAGAQVTAVEIDGRLASQLADTVVLVGGDPMKLTVLHQDALKLTEHVLSEACQPASPTMPTRLVANLPYNVSVPILLHLLAELPGLVRGVVMVQAEVGERLAAKPGTKSYGAPSVKAAWYGNWWIAGQVSRQVFWPVPNVDSILVAFERYAPVVGLGASERSNTAEQAGASAQTNTGDQAPAGLPVLLQADDSSLRKRAFSLVDAAFQQRRKMLRQALAGVYGSSPAASAALEAAGISPTARGEQLSLADFVTLAKGMNRGHEHGVKADRATSVLGAGCSVPIEDTAARSSV